MLGSLLHTSAVLVSSDLLNMTLFTYCGDGCLITLLSQTACIYPLTNLFASLLIILNASSLSGGS